MGAMAGSPEDQTPRLDPMSSPEARAEYIRELKALVEADEYHVPSDVIARALLAQLVAEMRSE